MGKGRSEEKSSIFVRYSVIGIIGVSVGHNVTNCNNLAARWMRFQACRPEMVPLEAVLESS
jgi:hypothetical protein